MRRTCTCSTGAFALMFVVSDVAAQQAGRMDVGGFEFEPTVTAALQYDDNVARTPSDAEDSWASLITPEFKLINDYGGNLVQLGYRLSRGDYLSTDADDFTDHLITGDIDYAINNRHQVAFHGEYHDGHDPRGTAYSIGRGEQLTEVDTFKNSEIGLTYRYGAESADAGLELGIQQRDIDYDGDTQAFLVRDRDLQLLQATLFYKVAPNTDVLLDVSHNIIEYDVDIEPGNPLDSDETRALVGVRWVSSAATTGYAKIGYQEKEFDSSARESFNGVDWAVGVEWTPVDRTLLSLSTQRDTNETNGEGNFIESKRYRFGWRHEWLERLSTRAGIEYRDDTYERAVNVREDEVLELRLSAQYQFRRWIGFELAYQFDERQSNRPVVEYDRNLITFSVHLTL